MDGSFPSFLADAKPIWFYLNMSEEEYYKKFMKQQELHEVTKEEQKPKDEIKQTGEQELKEE